MKKTVLCILFFFSFIAGNAQVSDLRVRIENGINSVQQFWAAKDYEEAFGRCFELDRIITKYEEENKVRLPEIHYLPVKQLFHMYLNSSYSGNPKCTSYFTKMKEIANEVQNDRISLDVLRSAALYYQKFGTISEQNKYFRDWIAKKMEGKDSVAAENAYQSALALADKYSIASLTKTLKEYHKHLQDSLQLVREAEMIRIKKIQLEEEAKALEESRRNVNIAKNILIVVLALLAIACGVLDYMLFKKYRISVDVNKKLNDTLKNYIDSNTHRGEFVKNVCGWVDSVLNDVKNKIPVELTPSDLASDIQILQSKMKSLQEYTDMESNRENMYERKIQNILPICHMAIDDARPFLQKGIDVILSVPNQLLPLYDEGIHYILSHLLINAAINTSSGKITIDFKRRSPKTCQLIITDTGSGIPAEKCSNLFMPYTCIGDLHESDGLGLPICSVIAYRMCAELKYDNEYIHGARFILEFRQ